jgi:D-3-phosphoglycerate dehydrogenase
MTKPHVLMIGEFPEWDFAAMREAYEVTHILRADPADPALAATADRIRGIQTRGEHGASAALMRLMPKLEIVSVYGVGYDAVDRVYAKEHGIAVTNTPGVLTEDVADHGLALLLATARQMPQADAYVRSGRWHETNYGLTTATNGKRVGFAGMGQIGQALAKRLVAMKCQISYFARHRNEELPYRFAPDLVELAGSVDFLIVIMSGGEATRAIISREVIKALGPDGILINIARGSTIDENALIEALESGAIRAAGLDVFLNEPDIDPRFMALSNVVLQPHMGSATVETRKAMGAAVRNNLAAHFAGLPLPSPVL